LRFFYALILVSPATLVPELYRVRISFSGCEAQELAGSLKGGQRYSA